MKICYRVLRARGFQPPPPPHPGEFRRTSANKTIVIKYRCRGKARELRQHCWRQPSPPQKSFPPRSRHWPTSINIHCWIRPEVIYLASINTNCRSAGRPSSPPLGGRREAAILGAARSATKTETISTHHWLAPCNTSLHSHTHTRAHVFTIAARKVLSNKRPWKPL